MANFSVKGLNELNAQITAAEDVDKGTLLKVCRAGAAVLVEAWKKALGAMGKTDPVPLADSIVTKDTAVAEGAAVTLSFTGKHSHGASGGNPGTNAEVAYILEYGSPRMAAKHWMEMANDSAAEAAKTAMADAWNSYLNERGL